MAPWIPRHLLTYLKRQQNQKIGPQFMLVEATYVALSLMVVFSVEVLEMAVLVMELHGIMNHNLCCFRETQSNFKIETHAL